MKNFIVLLFFIPLFASAQKTHVVKAKETLYSLARLYNVHPRELAAYNNIPVSSSLTLGQVIKIPANTTMEPLSVPPPEKKEPETKSETVVKKEPEAKKEQAIKNAAPEKKETLLPVYHKVGKKETLYRISKMYENISIEDIKKWNKLTGDGLSEGTKLIVGYNKTGTANTAAVVQETRNQEVKPVVTEPVKAVEPEKKEEKIVKTEPVKKEAIPVKKEEPNITGKNFNGGVFRAMYDKQVNSKSNATEEKGQAGIFKSTSGWEDGKYYCLTNAAPAGTIVKITNKANNHAVYAKVLDLIPDLKQNAGLVIRVSNAAASELGATAENFESTINF